MNDDFLDKIREIIEENIADELFGVSELASEIGMSRSNLLRRVKSSANISASQFIRQVRLQKAMELLDNPSLTVSEISFKVGFSSTSYFIKCFREHYGYPPGEAGKRSANTSSGYNKTGQTHQLAAIMFTDIEGFTAIMQEDEEKAVQIRNRHREVFNSITGKFKGRILQYYGDGTLSTFNSAIEAVRCGIEMQLAFREEPRIPVRIGIHSGDIIFSDDGIIGDGVNIASRIESLAVAQSVFISDKIYDEVKNQQGIQTESMGTFELKNVGKPIDVYAISNPGLVVPDRSQVKGKVKSAPVPEDKKSSTRRKRFEIIGGIILVAALITGYLISSTDIFKNTLPYISNAPGVDAKKSIAVLPFINDSNDSSNVYFINGLMESTLNNLQKIRDLRVISRTSVEKYRKNPKSSAEIARELQVQYLIEGSGQKIGSQIMLHVQLIDAHSDQQVWSTQYSRQIEDIFELQNELANNIIQQIEVIISPEVAERINKPPTNNVTAYDYFLRGYDLMWTREPANLEKGIELFEKAIEYDPKFARAYATIAISYYYLDEGRAEKKYESEINYYADQALLYDEKLPQSLIAKGLYYMETRDYEMAVSLFEKALEYNPNYDLVYAFLVDVYVHYLPNTEKYLEYALKGLQIDIASQDSVTTSFVYLHLSNAFLQTGFIDEALHYIDIALSYSPGNLFAQYTKTYMLYARDRDLGLLKDRLLTVHRKDTNQVYVLQEVGKVYYYLRQYDSAYYYYKRFVDIRKAYNLSIFTGENMKIGYVFAQVGEQGEADRLIEAYIQLVENDQSIFRDLSLCVYNGYLGNVDVAMEHFRAFAQNTNFQYLVIPFIRLDPLMDPIRSDPDFNPLLKKMESNFWKEHKRLRTQLESEGLI